MKTFVIMLAHGWHHGDHIHVFMCIEQDLLPVVWSGSSALTLATAEPRWSPF
jgi:hypothetical protein